ncbi:MAG: hypothetical protein R3315_02895, partial [Woeseiaceae bacterium]|nr:hypothetical protein [Woeseiaceae bacterium]
MALIARFSRSSLFAGSSGRPLRRQPPDKVSDQLPGIALKLAFGCRVGALAGFDHFEKFRTAMTGDAA